MRFDLQFRLNKRCCLLLIYLSMLSFQFLDGVFSNAKVLSLMKFSVSNFVTCGFGVVAKMTFPNQGHKDLVLYFCLRVLWFSCLY